MSLSDDAWRKLKLSLPIGEDVSCVVTMHARFGFFVEIEDYPDANALVLAPDFEHDSKPMTPPGSFPAVASRIQAEVLDHVDQTKQLRLRVRAHGHGDAT